MASPHDLPPSSFGDMPTRPMRVKVLYTFDAESKTTCLARFTDTLQIPVVEIEEASHVGVISLSRCLSSITQASPELLPPLDHSDYAIYAYDYSEPETPLVGQGMLSAALTHQMHAETMITGRVCQNMPAIFSNGVKETLEVKLRLVPVKQATQSSGSASPRSVARSAGFDPNAWNNAMTQGRSPHETRIEQSVLDDLFNTDALQNLSGPNSYLDQTPAFSPPIHSAPGSRAASPMNGGDFGHMRHNSFSTAHAYNPGPSRPQSRASVHSEVVRPTTSRQTESSYDEYFDEDGQPRKRAKITQTDWRGRSSFGGKTGNLRVTASTAASMHMHRPIATRPMATGSNLEPPPRVPTPVPRRNTGPRRNARPSVGSRSLLRQASTMSTDMSDIDNMSDAIASSPEDESPGNSAMGGTPQDIPSSPPVFHADRSNNAWQHNDSGYMSERIRPEDSISAACSPEFDLPQPARPFIKREESSMQSVADAYPFDALASDLGFVDAELPQEPFNFDWPGNVLPADTRPREQSQAPSRAQSPMPGPTHGSRRGSLALPGMAARKRQPSQQPRGYLDSEAGSPAPSEYEGRPSGPRRSGSGAHRRKVIQDRLHTAIAKGEMPQYCAHCGAIETPTWRRLYVKVVDGKPSPLDEVEGEGEVVGVEQIEFDDNNVCTKFIVRKSMKKTKDSQPGKGFNDIQLCNPCGLWFSKTKKMRPQDKWGRRSGTRKSRKAARNAETGEMTDGVEPQSEAFFTDNFGPEEGYDDLPVQRGSGSEHRSGDGYDTSRSRSMSGEDNRQPADQTTRQARSSPGQVDGTAESPIELEDKTPKPTRRLLFPSPRSEGETKTLDNTDLLPLHKRTPSADKLMFPPGNNDFAVYKVTATDKENMPPLDELLGTSSRLFKTPQKTPLRRSPRSLAKQCHFSMPGSPTPNSRKRKALAESTNAANAGKANAHDFMTSPASSRYFLRSTPTRLANTPGRSSRLEGSAGKRSHDVSPFSKQLAEMLTHDTSLAFNSPSTALAFADLPPFPSPGGGHIDWDNLEALMSSDFAAPAEKSDLSQHE